MTEDCLLTLANISKKQGPWQDLKPHKHSKGNDAKSVQQLPYPSSWIRENFKRYRSQGQAYIQQDKQISINDGQQDSIKSINVKDTVAAIPNNTIPCFASTTTEFSYYARFSGDFVTVGIRTAVYFNWPLDRFTIIFTIESREINY
jgi:hypothetical protein